MKHCIEIADRLAVIAEEIQRMAEGLSLLVENAEISEKVWSGRGAS